MSGGDGGQQLENLRCVTRIEIIGHEIGGPDQVTFYQVEGECTNPQTSHTVVFATRLRYSQFAEFYTAHLPQRTCPPKRMKGMVNMRDKLTTM